MEGRWRSFTIVSVGVFISVLDLFIVNIAFPAMQKDFSGTSLAGLSWVLSAYAIVFAALLVPAGKLGDVIGRKKVFQAGLLTFVTGSALSAVAPSVGVLIAARVVQAVGAAAMTPTSLGLVLPLFPANQAATVIGIWAALGGVGAAMGPPIGGLLVEASWRWIFLVNIPLGLATVVLAQRQLKEIKDPKANLPDGLGSGMLIAAVTLLTLGIVEGETWHWDERVFACFVAAATLGTAFVRRSSRHRSPVLELELFKAPAFSLASLGALLYFAAFSALLLASVMFLTQIWGYSELKAGFAVAPGPMMAAIFAAGSGRFSDRFGAAAIGAPGGILFALASLWMILRLGTDANYVSVFLPGQLVGGIGVGLILPSFTAAAVTAISSERLAAGIGAQTTFRQIGAALGVATWVAIVGTPSPAEALDSFDKGFIFIAAASLASSLTLLALVRTTARRRSDAPVKVDAAVVPIH